MCFLWLVYTQVTALHALCVFRVNKNLYCFSVLHYKLCMFLYVTAGRSLPVVFDWVRFVAILVPFLLRVVLALFVHKSVRSDVDGTRQRRGEIGHNRARMNSQTKVAVSGLTLNG